MPSLVSGTATAASSGGGASGFVVAPAPTGDATVDVANLQAAIDSARSVHMREGTYMINAPLKLNTRQTLRGAGQGSTILKSVPDYNDATIVFKTPNCDKVTVSDFTIDGDAEYASRTAHHGIVFDNTGGTGITQSDSHHKIERVRVQKMGTDGILLICSTGANPEQRQTHLMSVEVYNAGRDCVSIAGVTDGTMVDVTVSEGKRHGYNLGSSGNMGVEYKPVANWRIVGCKAFYCGYGDPANYDDGWRIYGLRNALVGCEAQDNSRHGFTILLSDNSLTGCISDANGRQIAGAGFHVAAGAVRTRIEGLTPNYTSTQDWACDINEAGTFVSISSAPTATGAFLTGTKVAESNVTINGASYVASKTITADYTLTAADAGLAIDVDSPTAVSITLPASVMPVGSIVEVIQLGEGKVTLVPDPGVTVTSPASLSTRARYSTVGIRVRGNGAFAVSGDLE